MKDLTKSKKSSLTANGKANIVSLTNAQQQMIKGGDPGNMPKWLEDIIDPGGEEKK